MINGLEYCNAYDIEGVTVFVKDDGRNVSYLYADDDFTFNINDDFNETVSLSNAYYIGNKLNQIPTFIKQFCNETGFQPMRCAIKYELEMNNG